MTTKVADINDVIKIAKNYLKEDKLNLIRKAYKFAEKAHRGQKRFSGEPYINHPVMTAKILLSFGFKVDISTIISCILHDTVEDTNVTLEQIRKNFGDDVAMLVDGMSKVEKVRFQGRERQIESLKKMFVAMAKDLRVIFIKFADRIHNLKTLSFVRPDKQRRIARESLEIYASVAHRLGIHSLKDEIEDLCFKHLYPHEYKKIKTDISKKTRVNKDSIKKAHIIIRELLKKEGISADLSGRIKHYFSTYRKLKRKNLSSIDEVFDLIAVRVVVKDVSDCYKVLGVIHSSFTPIPQKFKDYISIPKQNGYQSLHTTLIGLIPDFPIEIQIRTEVMHREAEYGLAVHWHYKEESGGLNFIPDRFAWIKSVAKLNKELKNPDDYIESIKLDIFSDRIFVLTPRGDVKILPRGATAIDFAYSIHSEVGHKCIGAKANDKMIQLNKPLQNAQIVEIITSKNFNPRREWLSSAITSQAKSKIRAYFNTLDKNKTIDEGKQLLNKQLVMFNKEPLDSKFTILKKFNGKKTNLSEREEILRKIGNGTYSALNITKKIFHLNEIFDTKEKKLFRKKEEPKPEDILIGEETGFLTKFGKCCNPKIGDKIVGYSTRGLYITIHKNNCKTLRKLGKERFLSASWSGKKDERKYIVNLILVFDNRIGLLSDISTALAEQDIGILDVRTSLSESEERASLFLKLELNKIDDIQNVLESTNKMKGFIRADFRKEGDFK